MQGERTCPLPELLSQLGVFFPLPNSLPWGKGELGSRRSRRLRISEAQGGTEVLRQATRSLWRRHVAGTRGNDANDIAESIHQRATGLTRLNERTDLEMARIVPVEGEGS
jgi:hypothetical protein